MFFNIGPNDNPFFQFLDKKSPLDLTSIFTSDFSLNSYIQGYIGTSTVPNCERGVCWYIINQPFEISEAQIQMLKINNVAANKRNVKNKLGAYKQYDAKGLYLA
jgi:carbonic anhydrase